MARKYTEVRASSGRPTDEGITDIHVVTGFGGPLHLVVSADDQELVDSLTEGMVELLAERFPPRERPS